MAEEKKEIPGVVTLYVVTEIGFDYNDEYYYTTEGDPGFVRTAYRSKENADEECERLNKWQREKEPLRCDVWGDEEEMKDAGYVYDPETDDWYYGEYYRVDEVKVVDALVDDPGATARALAAAVVAGDMSAAGPLADLVIEKTGKEVGGG